VIYRVLADAVVLLHFVFLLFVVLGGLLVLRWWKVAWLHLPAVAWGAFVEMYLRYCPLTPLENRLREQGGLGTYDTGFIDHYIVPLIYPPGLTPSLQFALGVLLIVFYAIVYAIAWRRRSMERQGRPA
jgi:hypothetical protein